jgi:pilus assembly protein CpaE
MAEQTQITGLPQDGLEAAQIAVQTRPDVLIVHEDLPAADGYEVCSLVKMAAPEVGCILLVTEQHPPVVRQAMLAGANAVLGPGAEVEDVLETIGACAAAKNVRDSELYETVVDPTMTPVAIGLISAKDGVGKTTLAVNLSVLLAKRFPGEVVVADMYAQLGDVSLLLKTTPQGSLVDLAAYAAELDIELVNSHLSLHRSGLRFLSGATNPEPITLDILSVPYLATLLGILRRNYRFALCDLPPTLWQGSLYTLSRCQVVLVVTNLFELATIRDTSALLRIIVDGGYVARDSVRLVANRTSSRDRFTVADLEEATGMKVEFNLPNDTDTVTTAGNRGEPFILEQPRAEVSRGIGVLADWILQATGHADRADAA